MSVLLAAERTPRPAHEDVLSAFAEQRVLIIGDAMLDSYLHGDADRLCREAPVPIVSVRERHDVAGGAANTAANVAALGGRTRFLTVLGADQEASVLRGLLDSLGVCTDLMLEQSGRGTLAKQRLLAAGQLLLRFDHGSTEPMEAFVQDRFLALLDEAFEWCTALIVSDYGYGVLTEAVLDRIARLQRQSPRLIVVDAKDLSRYRAVGVTAVKPNRGEALSLLGLPSSPADPLELLSSEGPRVTEIAGARMCAITLDRDGALLLENGRPPHRVYARPAPSPRTAGAGDTYLAALALALSAGATGALAAEIAGAASDLVVSKNDTARCSIDELRVTLRGDSKYVPSLSELCACLDRLRTEGRRIVLTCGCFDILHRGHIGFLNRAKALGDVLVVALNDDASVSRVKGLGRPLQPLEDRIELLTALSCVDLVTPLSEDAPINLIQAIRPDLFAKGGNYTRDRLPEASAVEAAGGQLEILPYDPELSTAAMLSRLRGQGPGASEGPLLVPNR